MALKKWEIPDLPESEGTLLAARTILASRLRDVLALVDAFRREQEEEALHQLRIALRRLRYPMETFLALFPRRNGLRFLAAVNALQKSAGDGRDLDVMLLTLSRMRDKDPSLVPESLLRRFERRRRRRYAAIGRAFASFLAHDALYAFKVMIAFDEPPAGAVPAGPPPAARKEPARKRKADTEKKSRSRIPS